MNLTTNTAAAAVAAFLSLQASHAVSAEPVQPARTFRNTVGMEFVLLPAGTFLMGSADTDPEAVAAEKPRHRVTLTSPFYLARYEVTQAQWRP